MAEELVHGFTGGLNKDLATSIVQADSYIDANNIRIVTQEGQSSGILMNILGNQFSFSIPDVLEDEEKAIPASSNLQVIGWTTIRDTIVLFTCPEVANGTGQIWTVEYNNVTQTTSGPILKYNQLLNFDSKHPIQAIGRYETTDIQRVYWTDNYNPPRNINLAATDVADTDLDLINLTSTTTINIPILKQINTGGGSLLAGSYQYTYRLKKTNGTYSVFAPLSNPVNITASSETTDTFQQYEGSLIGTNTGKSVTYTIENTDDSYSTIEHVFIFKNTYNTIPSIYMFKEDFVTIGTITITHDKNSNTNYIPITLEELLIFTQNDFQRAKTIATKDNMLFFGNTKSEKFSIDLDTRAYRFDNTRIALLKNKAGTTSVFVSGITGDYNIVDSNFDCINPYNAPGFSDSVTATDQYKYQADGTTLGGQGAYIKYQFTTKDFVADNVANATLTTAPFIGSDRVNDMQANSYFTLDSSGQQFEQNNGFYSLKSPYFASIYTGYARGEIYRFGIVFFDKQGRQSYVNWIGDIKFPEAYVPGYELSYNNGNKTYIRQLGITFTITIPTNIKNNIQGYSIVRLERPDTEKTKLGIGVGVPILYPSGSLASNKYTSLGRLANLEPNLTNFLNKAMLMVSPSINFNNYSFSTGDYLKNLGNLTANDNIKYDEKTSGGQADPKRLANYSKLQVHNNALGSIYRFPIDSYKKVGIGEKVPSTFSTTLQNFDFANVYNSESFTHESGFFGEYTPADTEYWEEIQGVGETKGLFCLKDNYSYTLDSSKYTLYSINKDLTSQYGGNTYSDRSTNTYISCNHYFPISKASILGYDVFDIFGGDTYVNYFDIPTFEYNYDNSFRPSYASVDPNQYVAKSIIFPAESSINTDFRNGRHFAKSRNSANMTEYVFDDFTYNQVYSQQNNTRTFISTPLIDTTQEEFDSRIWYSKTKINGEQTDNWTFIDGYKDIESVYGPINRLEVLNDNLFAFQDRALANILVNPLSVIQDNNASNLVLGKATGVIQKHIYLSTEIGTKHQWSVVKSDKSIYWFDILGKRLCTIESTTKGAVVLEVSDVKGLFSYFQENLTGSVNDVVHNNPSGYLIGDSPTYQYGITAGYDYRNKEVVFTFLDSNKQFTLAYSEVLGKYTSFYSFKPNIYIYTKDKFISPDPDNLNQLYLHNIDNTYGTFYTNNYDSDISVITNKFPTNTKVFDNLELFSEVSINNIDNGTSFNKVQCTTKYQDSSLITLQPGIDIKRRERSWRLFVPRDTGTTGSTFQARLRDKYLITKLIFTNTGNKKLLMHWLKVLFRASIS